MKNSCKGCGYYRDGYCADRDCEVDPFEPECNYDD